jgi:putative ABC transport system permease protein
VELRQHNSSRPGEREDVAPANFVDWRERAADAIAMAGIEPYSRTYSTREGPERVPTWLVTDGFFEILGTRPLLGRTFTRDDFAPGRDHVLVLGYGVWTRKFGADPTVIGRSVVMDKEPYTIVGVMPAGFDFPRGRDVWSPKVFSAAELAARTTSYYRVVGRLQSGVAMAAAQARLDTVAQRLREQYPRENANVGIAASPLKESLVGAARPILIVFLVGVALLLIVACVNVSNLLLVRLLRREHEFGVRVALGAGAGRVRRQILTESLVLASLGAVAATLLARWSTSVLRTAVPATLPRAEQMTVGWPVIALGCALAVVTAAAVCLVAMARAGDSRLALRLSSQIRTATSGKRSVQHTFVAAELAVAMILLVTAGLFVRSLVTLLSEPRGFRVENVAIATMFAWQEYPEPARRAAFIKQVVERLADVPGVDQAGAGSSLPLAERIGAEIATVTIPGAPATDAQPASAQASIVTPGYLEALDIRPREGRRFTWFDDTRAKPVVIVNERLARQHWPGRSAIGQRIVVRFAGAPVEREIVGVVADVRRELARAAAPSLYLPHAQAPTGSITFVAHTNRDASELLASMKRTIGGINGSIALTSVVTLDDVLDATVSARRFNLQLVAFFALASLMLATIGAYGVMTYATNERMKEIGIRIALGARAFDVVRTILRDGARIAGFGVLAGVVMAAAMSRLVRGMLYGIAPLDPPTYAAAAVVIAAIAAAACGLPAWRAVRTDVLRVLRAD